MPSALALIKKEQPKLPDESVLAYEDRLEYNVFMKLHEKLDRSDVEEKEYAELKVKVVGKIALESAQYPSCFADEDMKAPVERLHRELVDQFGIDTPQKKLLIQRIICAYSMAWSYERMFSSMRYRKAEYGSGYNFNYDADRTKYLAEVRRGMESTNDQIIRLTQALQNLVAPPIQVKATNAFFAQNQQINQKSVSKVSEKNSVPRNGKTTR